MPSAIDFGELLHGVDVIEDFLAGAAASAAFRDQAHGGIKHCLNLLMERTQDAKGTAAQELTYILYDLAIDPAQVYPEDVQKIRAAIRELAIDYATCHEMDDEGRRHQAKQASARGSARKKELAEERETAWQKEADKIWKNNPRLSNKRVGELVSEALGGNADYISRKIKHPKKRL